MALEILIIILTAIQKNEEEKEEEEEEEEEEVFMDQFVKEIKVSLKATFNSKVLRAMKNLQALYKNGTNKSVEQAAQEVATKESQNVCFFICSCHMK